MSNSHTCAKTATLDELVRPCALNGCCARNGPEHIFHEGFVLFMCSIGGVFAYSRLSALVLASVLTDAVIPLLIAILMDMPLMSSFRSIARRLSSWVSHWVISAVSRLGELCFSALICVVSVAFTWMYAGSCLGSYWHAAVHTLMTSGIAE